MKQTPATAAYPMSQGYLSFTCHDKAGFMERDAASFATRGVTKARVDAFKAMTTAAGKLPSDEQLDYEKQVLTEAAQAQRLVVESGMAMLMSQVEIVHDNRTPAYKAFGSSGLYADSEGDFYLNMGHLLDYATLHVAEYATQGLTLAQLTALTAETAKYLAALKAQRQAICDRSGATQARQKALNALYDELAALSAPSARACSSKPT